MKDSKVAALMPSNGFVVRRVVNELKSEHRFVVEYGPGDGVITKALLAKMPEDGKLVAIERNKEFVAELRAIRDPRLHVIEGDVADLSGRLKQLGLPRVDYACSGIPLSLFDTATRRSIVHRTYRTLGAGGKFVVYQFSPLALPVMKSDFGSVEWHIELRNIPPYFIMIGKK